MSVTATQVTQLSLPTNSRLLAKRIPNARPKIYPDAGHGFHFHYPAEFAGEVERFLNDARSGRAPGQPAEGVGR